MLNPDKKFVKMIKISLKKTEGYCPCVAITARNEDNKCPCKMYRETKLCRCGLYVN